MSRKDWTFRISDMLDCLAHIERLIANHDAASFEADLDAYRAVERNLEIIAEASKYIPDSVRDEYPSLPWRRIVDMRNVISHAYNSVDEELIWGVVTARLPELKNVLLDIRERYGSVK